VQGKNLGGDKYSKSPYALGFVIPFSSSGNPTESNLVLYSLSSRSIRKMNAVVRTEKTEVELTLNSTELNIHEHTERGDNDTIKMPNGQKVVIDGKKCSDR